MTSASPPGPPVGPGRATARAVLELDHRSFDGFWRLDADGLTNAIEATPSSRFRVAEGADRLLAYAVTGRAGQHGYLQRLAVDPSVRREGYGRAIVLDGLRWLRRHGATQALVNTQCDNARGARALPSPAASASCRPACASWADLCEARRPGVRLERARGAEHRAQVAYGAPDASSPAATVAPRVSLLEQPATVTLGQDVPLRLAMSGSARGTRGAGDRARVAHEPHGIRAQHQRRSARLDDRRPRARPARRFPFAANGGRVLTLKLQDPNAPRDTSPAAPPAAPRARTRASTRSRSSSATRRAASGSPAS